MHKTLAACLRSLALLGASALPLLGTVLPAAAQQAYYIHADHLNTPRLIENQSQQVVWRWDNDDPFGANMANANPSGLGTFTFNLRLPGQYFDQETNYHYNYFRDYSPEIGRYIESDPIGLRGGANTYGYARANPIVFFDSTGLTIEDMNFILEQVKSQFSEIKPEGNIAFMGTFLNWWYGSSADGVTNPITGTMYLPPRYAAKECLSFNDWEWVFFRSIFHESMHSTDSIDRRLSKTIHEQIYNRVDAEAQPRSLPPVKKPTWGTPRAERINSNALYQEYLTNSPDCRCAQ